jgi:hypothetical protein
MDPDELFRFNDEWSSWRFDGEVDFARPRLTEEHGGGSHDLNHGDRNDYWLAQTDQLREQLRAAGLDNSAIDRIMREIGRSDDIQGFDGRMQVARMDDLLMSPSRERMLIRVMGSDSTANGALGLEAKLGADGRLQIRMADGDFHTVENLADLRQQLALPEEWNGDHAIVVLGTNDPAVAATPVIRGGIAPQAFDRDGVRMEYTGGGEQIYMEPHMRPNIQPVGVYHLDPETGLVSRVDTSNTVVPTDVLTGSVPADLAIAAGVGGGSLLADGEQW